MNSQMFGLITLPYEVLSYIVENVDFDDVFSLGQTCKEMRYLLTEESICKSVVQSKVPYSSEAIAARRSGHGNARALRRIAKRREAFTSAFPFSAVIVGFADTYLYCKGVLCYSLGDKLRILDLHNSGQREIVVDISKLLSNALSAFGNQHKGVFRILYYSHDIVSSLYRSTGPNPTAWLILSNVKTQVVLLVEELESTDKIFVRHDQRYLYYGTHSELGPDGYKKWVLRGYDFKSPKWFGQNIHLADMVGSDIGSTICFEFHQDYFYALSNQTSFEVEEIDWTSFYHCIRFPLGSPCNELLEKTENRSMWRRQHQEGPIDDRWTNLRLYVDESTGELKIIESRKEWYQASSKSQRTYYTTHIIFPERPEDRDMAYEIPTTIDETPSQPNSDQSFSSFTYSETSIGSGESSTSSATLSDHSDLPDDPILLLRDKDDHPNHVPSPLRVPKNTHPGDDGSQTPTFTLAKSRLRYYSPSASTFIDLVDDPLPTSWQNTQRLRLRAGSRRLGPPLTHPCSTPTDLGQALREMYRDRPVVLWPPAQDPEMPNVGKVDELYNLLNPPSHLGNVEGTADERSMVYVTGHGDKPQAVIFLSFDPAIRLRGLKKWVGLRGMKGGGEAGTTDETYVDVVEGNRTVVIDRKEKGKGKCCSRSSLAPSTIHGGQALVDVLSDESKDACSKMDRGRSWAWCEKAMYRDIGMGYDLGL